MTDLYEVMGVSPGVTQDALKKAWRDLARKHHPDRGGDADEFAAISKAYEVLSDPQRRQAYDVARSVALSVRCACGKTKVPGQAMCPWCALKVSQQHHQREREQRRAQKQADKEARRRARRVHRERIREAKLLQIRQDRERQAEAQEQRDRAPKPRRPGLGLPSADDILSAVMAEAALRGGLLDSGGDVDVHIRYDPLTGKMKLSGRTVEALEKIGGRLKLAEGVMRQLRRMSGLED